MAKEFAMRVALTATAISILAFAGCSATDDVPGGEIEEAAENLAGDEAPLEPHVGYPPQHPTQIPDDPEGPEDLKIGVDPIVIELTPSEARVEGGEIVTVNGDNFADGAKVFFGDAESPDVFYISETYLNVTTPPGEPGYTDVRVVNKDGAEGVLENGFVYYDDLEVHSVTPALGTPQGGDPVTLHGRGFETGVLVLFGDRIALDVQVISGNTLTAVTPPGDLGAADVRVVLENEIAALLEEGFEYVAAPEVTKVWPPHGPTIGGTQIEVTGRYFRQDMTVALANKPAQVINISEDGTQALIIAPGDSAGPATLVAEHAYGVGFLQNAFTYLAPAQGGVELWNVVPAKGSASGGYEVALIVQGLQTDQPISVTFGGVPATGIQAELYPDTVFVQAPPGAAGQVSVAITQNGETSTLANAFTYTQPLAVTSLTPTSGSAVGGEVVTIYGEGFSSGDDVSVFIGPLASPSFDVLADGQLLAQTPQCSPGKLDVTVVVDGRQAVLPGAFDCLTNQPHVFALDPPSAAQAGGGLVRVIGAGLPMDAALSFGGQPGVDVQWESQLVVWARVPRGDEGSVDVEMTSDTLSKPIVYKEGLKYINPANKKAGIAGGLIDRTINVSVFNSSNGKGLEGATAILGSDAQTKYQCITDDRGQCVISYHELRGPRTITAARKNFSAYTIAGFGGTNVTMYIRPQDPPAQQGPPGPFTFVNVNDLTGTISGRLNGIGKYVLPPPPNCAVVGSPDGQQCTPCNAAQPCDEGLSCQPLADTGSWCVKSCEAPSDCTEGFVCAYMGDGNKCIPQGGEITASCATSRRNFFGTNPDPGPGALVNPTDGTFSLTSRIGEVTVYCIAGYTHPQTGQFIATYMGVQPTVVVGLNKFVTDVQVSLTIPLSRTLRMRVFDLPEHEEGIGAPIYRNAVDVGAEGWIPLAQQPTWTDGEMRFFAGYPESLAPFGKDAAYTFYTTIIADTNGVAPVSYRLNYRLPSVDGDPIRIRNAENDGWDVPGTGMTGDLTGVWGSAEDDVWGVGPGGRMVHKGSLGWGPQPHFTDVDLNAISGTAWDHITAVGDFGTILEFAGATWKQGVVSPPIAFHLRAVHGDWAVGDGGIVRDIGAYWQLQEGVLHASGLRGVFQIADDLVIAVGESGKVLEYNGSHWTSTLAVPSGEHLNAVWSDGVRAVAVGDNGTIIMRNLETDVWEVVEPMTRRELLTVTGDASGAIFAAGTAGTVLRWDPAAEAWFDESQDGAVLLDIHALWTDGQAPLHAGGFTAVPVGPWMAFPDPISPGW